MGSEVEKSSKSLSPFKKALAVLAALTALTGAATPGVLGMMDGTDERADKKATRSVKKALEATEKAELAYRLLAKEITYLREDVVDQQDDTRQLRRFVMETIVLKMAEMSASRDEPVGSRRLQSRSMTASTSGMFSSEELALIEAEDGEDGLSGGAGGSRGGGLGVGELELPDELEGAEESCEDAQGGELPSSLDAAWKEKSD